MQHSFRAIGSQALQVPLTIAYRTLFLEVVAAYLWGPLWVIKQI